MAKARGAGPRPKVGKTFGKSRGGKSNIKVASGDAIVVPTNPSLGGPADVVRERTAQAMQGVMESRQLRANKSTGLGALGSVKARAKGKK